MATAEPEVDGVALGLVEPERTEPCSLSVMDEPVRVRARALRPLLRVLCPLCWLDARGARASETTIGLLLLSRAVDDRLATLSPLVR